MTSVLCSQEQLPKLQIQTYWLRHLLRQERKAASRLLSINHLLKQRGRACSCRADKIHHSFPFVSKENCTAFSYIPYTTSSTTKELRDRRVKHSFLHWCYSCENCTMLGAVFASLLAPGQRSHVTKFQKYLPVGPLTEFVFA